jgi:hypothetical protein
MIHLFFCLSLISLALGSIPSSTKVDYLSFFLSLLFLVVLYLFSQLTASIKDTQVTGVEGFNFNLVAPFKFQDYIVGFRYALGNFRKAPESLFLKRTFHTPGDGLATVNADYDLGDNSLNIGARWDSELYGVNIEAEGDTKRRLKNVGLCKSLFVKDNKLTVAGAYDILKKKASGKALLDADGTKVQVSYDSDEKDPLLVVTRALDERNDISPSIKLRSGEISYGYRRKWNGGSLFSKYYPGDRLSFEWKDQGASGTWTTTAEVPLADTTATKVSFSRDWNY